MGELRERFGHLCELAPGGGGRCAHLSECPHVFERFLFNKFESTAHLAAPLGVTLQAFSRTLQFVVILLRVYPQSENIICHILFLFIQDVHEFSIY